jgi:hypothetical protein
VRNAILPLAGPAFRFAAVNGLLGLHRHVAIFLRLRLAILDAEENLSASALLDVQPEVLLARNQNFVVFGVCGETEPGEVMKFS